MKIKNNSAMFIITSVVCLLPIILSFAVYNELPGQIAVRWDSAGNPDNFLPKALAAFGLPFLFMAVNIFSKLFLFNDPKRSANLPKVMLIISVWTPPVLSLVLVPLTLFIAMGAKIPIPMIAPVLVGIIFILCGNYMPKTRQNYTVGIKFPWTLHNADNWNKTHRIAGYLWVISGIILIAVGFIVGDASLWGVPLILYIIAVLLVVPLLYSYLLYNKIRKDKKEADD